MKNFYINLRLLNRFVISGSLVLLTITILITPLSNVYAQQNNTPPMQARFEDAPIEQSLETPPEQTPPHESTPISDEQIPADENPKPKEENPKKEKLPKDEEPISESLKSSVNTGGSGSQFTIPSQSMAKVDLSSGALIYDFDIDLPAGRAGMTPELSLKYDSRFASRPDSIVGLGWELTIPYIQREPIKGINNLYDSAYFSSSLSGNLIATSDTSSSQFTVYRPETDNGDYSKYTYNSDNSWTLSGKDGRTYTFGITSSSRQDNSSDTSKVFKWMLSKIVDSHGNEINYSYIKDSGQIYPNQIVYTTHPNSPAVHTVSFSYMTPSNYGSTVYNSAFAVTTYKVLQNITVTSVIDGQTATRSYGLSYDPAQYLKQYVLKYITRSGTVPVYENNPSFQDTTTFAYSTKNAGWQQGTHSLNGLNLPVNTAAGWIPKTYTADFDRNGYPDLLISASSSDQKFLLNTGTSFIESSAAWSLPSHVVGSKDVIVDLNGDKLPDLHPRDEGDVTTQVYLNTGSEFVLQTSNNWEIGEYIPEAKSCGPNIGDKYSSEMNTFLHDINNDGKNDILYFGGTSDFRVFLNNGNGWTPSTNYSFIPAAGQTFTTPTHCGNNSGNDLYQTLLDVNGDSELDYITQKKGIFLNTGSGFAHSPAYSVEVGYMDRSGFADFNRDGLLDLVTSVLSNGSVVVKVYLNTGNGFTQQTSTNWNPDSLQLLNNTPANRGTLLDVTADGYPDAIARQALSNGSMKVQGINDSRSAWIGFSSGTLQAAWEPMALLSETVYFDINTDGILDFITSKNYVNSCNCPSLTHMGKGSVPNRLTSITGPFGGQTTIDYSTAPTDLSDTDIAPTAVVKKITTQNIGQGQPSSVIQYGYSGGSYVIDPATGQNRYAGFHKVTATESGTDLSPLRIIESYFHQANGSDSSTNEPQDNNLSLIGKPYYTVVKGSTNTPKKETWNKYGSYTLVTEPLNSRFAKFIYTTETISKTTESSSTTGTAEVYTFDTTIGEQTELRNMGFVNVGIGGSYTDISGDTRYQFTEYANNSYNTIVKPKRTDIRTSASSTDTISRIEYYYDNQSHGIIGSFGDLTKETKWVAGNGTTVSDTNYTYDLFGNIATVTNPRNAVITYTYDNTKSLVATESNHFNHVTSYEYMVGLPKNIIDPNGRITSYGYTDKGWLYSTTETTTAGSKKRIQYLERSNIANTWAVANIDYPISNNSPDFSWQVLDGLARPTRLIRRLTDHSTINFGSMYLKETHSYDALGRLAKVSAPYGTSFSNDWGYAVNATIPTNLVTTTTYDVFDRPTSIANALGTTSISYAGAETTTIDANNKQKKVETDAYGNLIQVKEYNGSNNYTTNYTYNNQNLLTGITDALGNVRAFTYNNAGWLTNSEDLHAPGDSNFGSTSWTYDANGNQITETQPNGTVVTRVFDMLDRPASIDASTTAGTDFTYTYDTCTNGKGRVCNVSGTLPNSITVTKTYTYGMSDAPTSVTLNALGNSYTTGYQYTLSDQVKQITYPNNTIVRTVFGEWAQPSAVYTTLPGQAETTFAAATYHHTGQPATIVVTNGPTITYMYDSAKLYRKSGMTAVQGGNTVQSNAYTYDNVNNITQITEPNLTKTYTYDDLYRLTQAVHTPSNGGAVTYAYEYDEIGNITSANGNTYSYSGTGKTNPHAVSSIGTDSYTYDDNGNMATAPNQVLSFNWQNQPTAILVGGSTNITSAYDESGNRFLYQTPTNTEIEVGDGYLLRNNSPEISLSLGNLPIGTLSNGTAYSAIADHLGTPVKQINASGVVAESVSYDPFGKLIAQTGTLNTKKGYTGHEEDVDTGLVYAQARYYNPAVSRFYSQDPASIRLTHISLQIADPQSWNSYAYARNNPIILHDPDGEFWDTVIDLGFLAVDATRFLMNSTKAIEGKVSETFFNAVGRPDIAAVARTDKQYYASKIGSTSANLGISLAGTALPFTPVAGIKGVQKIEKGIDVAQSAKQSGISEVSPLLRGSNLRRWDEIIEPSRQTHILKGDVTGGGHAFGAGRGKGEFPQSWTDDDILRNTADIATDPKVRWIRQRNGNYRGEGMRDGILQRVILNRFKSKVITSHPVTRNKH